MLQLFHDGGPYHIQTSPLICSANQWNGFYIIGTSVMNEIRNGFSNTETYRDTFLNWCENIALKIFQNKYLFLLHSIPIKNHVLYRILDPLGNFFNLSLYNWNSLHAMQYSYRVDGQCTSLVLLSKTLLEIIIQWFLTLNIAILALM